MSYKMEVIADNSGKWVGNGVRLATEKEAQDYAADLFSRWVLVTETRVVVSEDPVNCSFVNGTLENVEKVESQLA